MFSHWPGMQSKFWIIWAGHIMVCRMLYNKIGFFFHFIRMRHVRFNKCIEWEGVSRSERENESNFLLSEYIVLLRNIFHDTCLVPALPLFYMSFFILFPSFSRTVSMRWTIYADEEPKQTNTNGKKKEMTERWDTMSKRSNWNKK